MNEKNVGKNTVKKRTKENAGYTFFRNNTKLRIVCPKASKVDFCKRVEKR